MKKSMRRLLVAVMVLSVAIGATVQALTGGITEQLYEWLSGGSGTTYYVDSAAGDDANAGTAADSAWHTLEKVNSVVFEPGDKILFKAGGSWVGQLMPQGSGNAEDGAIVIDKYGEGALPIINANGTTENDGAVVRLYNQEYIEISNLELINNSYVMGLRNGVLVIARDYGTVNHVYVRGCYIHDVAVNASKSIQLNSAGNGGDADNLANDGPACGAVMFRALRGGNRIPTNYNDILIDGNTIEKTGELGNGVAFASDWKSNRSDGFNEENFAPFFGSTNVLISNNNMRNTHQAVLIQAMDGSVGNGVIIENNVSYKPDNSDSNAGMWLTHCNDVIWQYNEIYGLDNGGSNDCGAFDADGNTYRTIFQYNYTHENRGEAVMYCNIHWDSKYEPTNAIGNVFRYNISENDMWGAKDGHGRLWVQKGARDSWFYNNVIYVGEGLPGKNIAVQESENNYFFNNIFINESADSTYEINAKASYVSQNNCFYGYHPAGEPSADTSNIVLDFDDPNPLQNAGSGGVGRDTLGGYQLAANSVCIGAGRLIENNGGRDFFGNAVSPTAAPDIGAHQTSSAEDTAAPTAPGNVTASADSFDAITVRWSASSDNVAIERYVVYVDGSPIGRTGDTSWTAKDLLANTQYRFTVRAFDAAGNYTDSVEVTARTANISRDQSIVKLTAAAVYDGNGNPCTEFGAQQLVLTRFTVTDGTGKPVANARVEAQTDAVGQNDYQFLASRTDENGVAELGFTTGYYAGEDVSVVLRVTDVIKEDRTYDAASSAAYAQLTIGVESAPAEKFGNLLQNSGFETYDTQNGMPTRWNIAVSDGIEAARVVEGIGPDESAALEITAQESYTALVMQNVSNVPNGTYVLTLFVKNTAPGASISVTNNGASSTAAIPVSGRWQQIAVPDISVTTGRISVQINVAGGAGTYTVLDNIELAKNLVKNPTLKKVMPVTNLPSNYFYRTSNGTVSADASGGAALKNDPSIGAIMVLPHYGANYINAFKVQSAEAFDITVGQTLTNLADGVYSFSISTVNTGGVEGTITVKDYGAEALTQSIGISSGLTVTKIGGIEVTSGKATFELHFTGKGSADDCIIVMTPDFSQRSDYPEQSRAIVFAGDNLLSNYNPSFEEDGVETPGAPTGWVNSWSTGTATVHTTSEDAHSGRFSAKINISAGSSLNFKPVTTTFTGLATGRYTFGAWIKNSYRVKLSATPDGTYEHDAYAEIGDEWKYVCIKDIEVTDGVLTVGFWNTTTSTESEWALIDDVELYLQEEYLENPGFESGTATGWSVADSTGFAEMRDTSVAYAGNKALRIVLPGTPSTFDITSTAKLRNLQPGLYTFTAYVKGTSVIEMHALTDTGSETVQSAEAGDDWQLITLTAEVSDSIKELGIRVRNPENTTSSYVTIDGASLIREVTTEDIASQIGDLKTVQKGETSIEMPQVREGFTIQLIGSSRPDVVALDGSVVTPATDTTVILTFRIINDADPSQVSVVTAAVRVMGLNLIEEEPDEQPSAGGTTQPSKPQDMVQNTDNGGSENNTGNTGAGDQNSGSVLPDDDGVSVLPDNPTEIGGDNNTSTEQTQGSGNGSGILLWIMLGVAILFLLLLTLMLLLALKKRREQQTN